MSHGLENLWDNLIRDEKERLLSTVFHLSFSSNNNNNNKAIEDQIRTRLAREGARLALAGDKLFAMFVCEFTPNPIYVGEFISFFGSNAVLTAFVTDFLQLPFEYRPGVNPLRLGDLYMACLALACLTDEAFKKLNYVAEIDPKKMEVVKKTAGRKILDWVLQGRDMTDCTLEELRRDVESRKKQTKEKRVEEAREMVSASLNCEDYNIWRKTQRMIPPLEAAHPVVRLKYMTRSGQERILFACLCCAAIEPKDCRCSSQEKVAQKLSAKNPNANGNDDDNNDESTKFLQEKYHSGLLEECRLTKTKALKVQNIAIWKCCGAEAAKVNTTPLGYEILAEKKNGCQVRPMMPSK